MSALLIHIVRGKIGFNLVLQKLDRGLVYALASSISAYKKWHILKQYCYPTTRQYIILQRWALLPPIWTGPKLIWNKLRVKTSPRDLCNAARWQPPSTNLEVEKSDIVLGIQPRMVECQSMYSIATLPSLANIYRNMCMYIVIDAHDVHCDMLQFFSQSVSTKRFAAIDSFLLIAFNNCIFNNLLNYNNISI